MKSIAIAGLLAAAASAATAQPFDFQRQTGSSEYVAGADTAQMSFAPVVPRDFVPSLTRWMLTANVDGIAPNRFEGTIFPSGPTRVSLYEVQRGSPEGIAYRDYHERYPAGTDWDRIAREFRDRHPAGGLASQPAVKPDAT